MLQVNSQYSYADSSTVSVAVNMSDNWFYHSLVHLVMFGAVRVVVLTSGRTSLRIVMLVLKQQQRQQQQQQKRNQIQQLRRSYIYSGGNSKGFCLRLWL